MAQGLSKKRKEAPEPDRLSSHKHARGRPTQPDGHGQSEPVAHRTRSKSRSNHLDLQPTSSRVSPAKTTEEKNWNPGFSSSKGSSHAIEEQRGRATVRANDRERGHAGRTTIEQGEQSGSAFGRMTKAGGSSTRRPRSRYVDNQGYVAPTFSPHRPTTRSQTRSYPVNNGGQAPNSSTLTLPTVATLPDSGVLASSRSDTQFHGKSASSSRATPREKPSKCRRKAVRNIGAIEPADLRSMRMLYERAFPKPKQPSQVRVDLAATCLKKLIERVISNSPLSVSTTITDLEFEQLDTAIYIVASILDELDREIKQEEVKSIQAMSLGSAPVRRAIRTLDSIGQFLCPTTYNCPGSPVPITSYVYATTWLNWAKLWIQNPSHSLFGTCRPGLASCPFFVAGAHACWTKTAKRFAQSVADQYSKSLAEDADRKLFAHAWERQKPKTEAGDLYQVPPVDSRGSWK
ncbi:hypothetical protein BLS_003386 [Venturia inaequalis]|uniref:Uncharacterized protein n=1 Tax=Venturia inaequalis TaxID=5025 RepID=A0A8H3UPJ5_VENIN|nr:hypothetical protein BLS_003386 [Venturia inaequalis]